MRIRLLATSLGSFLITLAAMPGAQAALGGDVKSVLRDHATLQTEDRVTSMDQYELHEAVRSDGSRVRQYVSVATGRVFRISFQGPQSPTLSALLGEFNARYLAAARAHRGGHHVLTINEPDLVLTILRTPRGWQGQAYLPQAVPAGLDGGAVR